MEYLIKQYPLEQGALEIQYIEEFFGEFPRRKTADEIIARLTGRQHLILMCLAPIPADSGGELRLAGAESGGELGLDGAGESVRVPVSFKVAHEILPHETDPKLADLVSRLHGSVAFAGRRILYSWIGGTRRDWRGQGHFRALNEEQEAWAVKQGFDEMVVKTKNKFYDMRGTLDSLRFQVVKYERNSFDNDESKVYLSKKLHPEMLREHKSMRTLVEAA